MQENNIGSKEKFPIHALFLANQSPNSAILPIVHQSSSFRLTKQHNYKANVFMHMILQIEVHQLIQRT
jgi:hypothetical protein